MGIRSRDSEMDLHLATRIHWGRVGTLAIAAVCLLGTGALLGGGGTAALEGASMRLVERDGVQKWGGTLGGDFCVHFAASGSALVFSLQIGSTDLVSRYGYSGGAAH